jgi:uncharacterized protein
MSGFSEDASTFASVGDEAEVEPGSAQETAAIAHYVRLVRERYGNRVVEIVLFGSRARGDARRDSDADIAVVLKDGDWQFWSEKTNLADLGHDILIDHGLRVGPWPVSQKDWSNPAHHSNPRFAQEVKRTGRILMVAL